ncbi:hypothetical protein TorRG33x02_042190, partial [Trema orientale]
MEGFRSLMAANLDLEDLHPCKDIARPEISSHKIVVIGGVSILWKDVEDLLKVMKIKLVPTAEKDKGTDHYSSWIKKRSGARELPNLESNVNYEKSEKGKGKT